MLALKKKREAEAKKAAEEAKQQAEQPTTAEAPADQPQKVSLLGIGGKKMVKNGETGKTGKKRTPGEIRIQTDIAELDGGDVATIKFPNPNDLTLFDVSVTPDTGLWKGATYHFTFTIPPHYPHSPPRVECNTKIYHPNIDLQGKVCLNILREDWKPVLDINSVIYGLIYLFYEPNPDDPLNHEAAELFRKDKTQFERLVMRTLRGGILDGVHFERLV
ncbi:ubiquitin-conjugating enzyme E2 M [Fistulifera solaris]|uniref:Ubiquitin-conjugating enzyme E2 M n=1 Tax=Fistulifera solaris TaxID=1519565 RepID=A0A1Z5JUQ9_FISSO|nr:ubiquitin-conjugating enzyme E2 M [Fistulifera solaris]|eukprot:GAX17770.1 ubiquitin-conjugating enzyme E2 M [Fistulifera solaris]